MGNLQNMSYTDSHFSVLTIHFIIFIFCQWRKNPSKLRHFLFLLHSRGLFLGKWIYSILKIKLGSNSAPRMGQIHLNGWNCYFKFLCNQTANKWNMQEHHEKIKIPPPFFFGKYCSKYFSFYSELQHAIRPRRLPCSYYRLFVCE